MRLGNFIKQYREEHNLSQRAFAELCGVSNGYISLIERDKIDKRTGKPSKPKIDSLMAIAKGMGLTLQELVGTVDVDIPVDSNPIKVKTPTLVIEDYVETKSDSVDGNRKQNAEYSSNIAERLREYRTSRGLSFNDMEHLTGIPAQTLNRYELGQRSPKLDTAIAIADALNVHPMWLQGYNIPSPNVSCKTEISTCAECALRELNAEAFDVYLRLSPKKQKEALNYLRYLESID